MKKAPNVVEMR